MLGRARMSPNWSELRVADRLSCLAFVWCLSPKAAEQRLVGEDVDAPREPSEVWPVGWRIGGKQVRATISGGAHAKHQVLPISSRRSGASAKLCVIRSLSWRIACVGADARRVRLAEKHDDAAACAGCFQIGEQADFFQRSDGMACASSTMNDDLPVGRVDLQSSWSCNTGRRMVRPSGSGLQFVGDGVVDFVARQRHWRTDGFIDVFGGARAASGKHCLAAADFAADLDDSFVVRDGVDQASSVAPRLAPEKRTRCAA